MDFFVLILSLLLTSLVYSLFPLIFTGCIKEPITKKKYRRLCWGVNLIPMCISMSITLKVSYPYFFWTEIFTIIGMKILRSKELLLENDESNLTNEDVDRTKYEECEEEQ